jgi:2-haloacid dehalogenase
MHQHIVLFDINETVLDLSILKPKFKQHLGHEHYMGTWFSMLLHSSTVCLATNLKTDFKSLALASLKSLAGRIGIILSEDASHDILGTLANLPPHRDIKPALTKLRSSGFTVVAFSNSSSTLLSTQLSNAGLDEYFEDAISVENAGTFKPAKSAYQYAVNTFGLPASEIRLIAAHDWDTHGALSAGLKAAYIDRFNIPYNPLYKKPDLIDNSMERIAERIINAET